MNYSSQPRVSIVTPVYNNVEHLAESIESVLAQTYRNIDFTIVNNCSTDGSREVACEYAIKHPQIRVHHNQRFLASIPNHNASLRLISPHSKYCKIVFADDWIYPDCIERMVNVAEEHPSVGIVGAYVLEGRNVICTGIPHTITVLSGREACRQHLLDRVYAFGSANSLLYRADLIRIRDPFFNEANIHADTEACFALLRDCDFGFVHQVLTATRIRAGSLNAKSLRMESSLAGWLHVLRTYGSDFLSEAELNNLLDEHLSNYYQFLGKSLFLGRSKEFWDYHRNKMNESAVGFSQRRLVQGALATLGDLALNPKRTFEKWMARRNSALANGVRHEVPPEAEKTDRSGPAPL